MEEKRQFGALTVYRGTGAYLRRLEQFEKAKVAYDKGYETAPENVALLIGRSQVCADSMRPEQAYADAEAALKLDSRSMQARNVQAHALYAMSDFERSVIVNYRGSRLRRQPPYFTEGIIQGLETIQDCVGKNADNVMLEFLPLIKQVESQSTEEDLYFKRKHVSRIPKPKDVQRMTQMQKRKHEILARVLAYKYLGPMAYDKFFLEELIKDRRIPSANAAGSEELQNLIKQYFECLVLQQDKLRTQRPYYTVKLSEKTESKYLTKYKKELLARERQVSINNAERYLKQIDKAVRAHRLKDVITVAERMQTFLDSRTPHTLPDKDAFVERLYRAVGEGYLAQHRLSYSLSETSNRRRIAFLMGLPTGRPRSFDSVMATYPYKFVDVNLTIEKVNESIEMCENPMMGCWLKFEMARLQNSVKNYALAKFYAKRCQQQAQELGSTTWWINGCFVLMAGDMQQMNQNDIRIAVEDAYEYSKKMLDPTQVQAFLAKCAEVAASLVPPDEIKIIKQRENLILKGMDNVSKVNAGVLFKRISTLPHGRRFAVLPRKTGPTTSYASERRRRKQRGLTVVPGAERELPRPPTSKIAGFQKFDI